MHDARLGGGAPDTEDLRGHGEEKGVQEAVEEAVVMEAAVQVEAMDSEAVEVVSVEVERWWRRGR